MCWNEEQQNQDETENDVIVSSVKADNYESIADYLSSENSPLFFTWYVSARLVIL